MLFRSFFDFLMPKTVTKSNLFLAVPKINSNFALATLLGTKKQQNKDTKELLQSLVTTSLTQKKKASKNMGYLPEVLFFNAFELGEDASNIVKTRKTNTIIFLDTSSI